MEKQTSANSKEWVSPGFDAPNVILKGDGFHISFNRDPSVLGDAWGGDDGQCETALKAKNSPYLILNGDWRSEYEQAIDQGFDACLAVYEAHKDTHRSSWSED